MNRFFTLLLAASCLTAVGQVTYPYNPDGNADGDIAVGDLQDFLVTYGNPFSPSEIMVGDSSLTYWVEQLSQTVQEQQILLDSLTLNNVSITSRHYSFPLGLNGEGVFFDVLNSPFVVPEGKVLAITSAVSPQGGAALTVAGTKVAPLGDYSSPIWANSGDVITLSEAYSTGSVMTSGILFDATDNFNAVNVDLMDGDFEVPQAKKMILYRGFHEGSTGFITVNGTNVGQAWSFSLPKILQSGDQLSFSGTPTYCSALCYLVDEDYFETPLEDASDEDPAEDNLGPCQGEFTVNYHGYDYELVEIGDQCWFAENCRFLPEVSSGQECCDDDLTPRAFVHDYFGNDQEEATNLFSYRAFGALYSYSAAEKWDLCPSGMRVASWTDWNELIDAVNLGGGIQGAGKALMRSQLDLLGFGVLPAGKALQGGFSGVYNYGTFWAVDAPFFGTSDYRLQPEFDEMNSQGEPEFLWSYDPDCQGRSVRCIKDTE